MTAPRLLLLEFLNPHPYNQVRGEALPFVQAYVRGAGGQTRWVSFGLVGGPQGALPDPDAPVDLAAAERDTLRALLAELGTTHVLTTHRLTESLAAVVAEAAPSAPISFLGDRFVDADATFLPWLCDWLGLPAPADPEALLVDVVARPDFESTAADDRTRVVRPGVRVIVGAYTFFEAPLARSPYHLPLHSESCNIAEMRRPYPYRTPPTELALRQIEAARATLPDDRRSEDFMLHGADVLVAFDRFVSELERRGTAPATFLCSVHPDAVLAAAPALDRALPRLAAAGHRLVLANLGLLNFSAAECERLETIVTPAEYETADRLLRSWARRFPQTFHAALFEGACTAIFTPWTTLEDLRLNIAAARQLGFQQSFEFFTTTRLRIVPGSSLAARLVADGLACEHFEPLVFGDMTEPIPGASPELAWRFAHPEVGRVHMFAARMSPPEGPRFTVDALFAPAQRMRGVLPLALRDDPLATLGLLVDAVAEAPDDADLRRIVARFLTRAGVPDAHVGLEDALPAEPGEPLPAEDEAALRDARLVRERLESLDPAGLASLQGYRTESVILERSQDGLPVIAITLRLGEERLVVNLLPRRAVRGSFAFTTRFAICYHQDTPIDTREKELAVQSLTELVEKATTA